MKKTNKEKELIEWKYSKLLDKFLRENNVDETNVELENLFFEAFQLGFKLGRKSK